MRGGLKIRNTECNSRKETHVRKKEKMDEREKERKRERKKDK